MMIHDDTGMSEHQAVRLAELREAEPYAANSFETHWAGGAPASALRDDAAGRVTGIWAGSSRRPIRS